MCTFNKMMNGEQIMVQFHVDDLKVSHKEESVLEDFLGNLRNEFGRNDGKHWPSARVFRYYN